MAEFAKESAENGDTKQDLVMQIWQLSLQARK